MDPANSRKGAGQCSSPPTHALLLPYPDQGHINPLMQLGIRLAAQGVQVTLAIPDHVHAKILHAQQHLANALQRHADDDTLQIVGMKDGLRPHFNMKEMKDAFDYTLEEGALELVHTLASQGRPVTCIVGDFFLRWTGSLAAQTALPEFVFWPQGASVLSIFFNVDAIISAGYDPFGGNGEGLLCLSLSSGFSLTGIEVFFAVRAMSPRDAYSHKELEANCVPGLPFRIHPADLPFEFPFEDGLAWLHKMLTDRLNRLGESQGVICNSFEALEAEASNALTLQFQSAKPHPLYGRCWPSSGSLRLVGPLVPKAIFGGQSSKEEVQVSGVSLWQEEVEECKQWLDSQPAASVMFVAFGSMTPISVMQVRELAWGLAASGHRFLWVIREQAIRPEKMEEPHQGQGPMPPPPPMQAMPVETILPEGFLEQNRHVCKVVRWAPQASVLSHPSVGGFFSHCGWNSTLESISSGVPMLGWPSMMDQVTNCWLATHVWKVGLTLERNQDNHTSRERVARGVRQLMEATSVRARARDLALLARKAGTDSNVVSSMVEDMRRALAPS